VEGLVWAARLDTSLAIAYCVLTFEGLRSHSPSTMLRRGKRREKIPRRSQVVGSWPLGPGVRPWEWPVLYRVRERLLCLGTVQECRRACCTTMLDEVAAFTPSKRRGNRKKRNGKMEKLLRRNPPEIKQH